MARTGTGTVTNAFGMLHSLLFISVRCYDQLSQTVYQHWSQSQVSYMKVTSVLKFSCKSFYIITLTVRTFPSTYIRAFHIRVSVAVYVCVWCISLSLTSGSVLESPSRLDEEHRLIARYAARLAAEAGNSTVSVSQDAPWWASVNLHFTFNALTSYCSTLHCGWRT